MANTKYDEIARLCGKRKNEHDFACYHAKANMKRFKDGLAAYLECGEAVIEHPEEPEYNNRSGAFKFAVSIDFRYTLHEIDDNCKYTETQRSLAIEFDVGIQGESIIFLDKQFKIGDNGVFSNILEYIKKTVNAWDGK